MQLIDPGPNPPRPIWNGAVISDDGLYRYRLWRRWDDGPRMVFVMLNPSTADHSENDPTTRRCIGYAKREGCASIDVINLFALRTTKPVHLLDHPDPEGPDQEMHWRLCLQHESIVVAVWGANARQFERVGIRSQVLGMAQPWTNWKCLGFNDDGSPRHPLYVPADAPLVSM